MTGVSLTVVQNGQPYLTKGYGVKNLQTLEPVDENTMFVIASLTKAFVATTMAKTIEEHEGMSWMSRVEDEIGNFHFSDPIRTQKVTIRDLLAHRTGLPRNDVMRIHGFSIDELMERLRFLEFTQEFRDGYKYNNLMYGLASYIIQKRYNLPWEDVARSKLFGPLHMNDTTFVNEARHIWNDFATAYGRDGNTLREIPLENAALYYGTISAPGGVSTNAKDMAKWMIFHSKRGLSAEGTRVVSESLMKDLHVPVNVIPSSPAIERPSTPFTKSSGRVGLGWFEGHYKGWPLSTHSGSISGYTSLITLMPTNGSDIGVYVAVNGPVPPFGRDFIHMFIIDILLGESPWVDLTRACPASFKGNGNNIQKARLSPKFNTGVQSDNSKFGGEFGNFAYGNLTVYHDNPDSMLYMRYGDSAIYELVHVTGNDYRAMGVGPLWTSTYNPVSFEDDGDGFAIKVKVPFEPETPPIEFERGLKQMNAPGPRELCPTASSGPVITQTFIVVITSCLGSTLSNLARI